MNVYAHFWVWGGFRFWTVWFWVAYLCKLVGASQCRGRWVSEQFHSKMACPFCPIFRGASLAGFPRSPKIDFVHSQMIRPHYKREKEYEIKPIKTYNPSHMKWTKIKPWRDPYVYLSLCVGQPYSNLWFPSLEWRIIGNSKSLELVSSGRRQSAFLMLLPKTFMVSSQFDGTDPTTSYLTYICIVIQLVIYCLIEFLQGFNMQL